MNLTKARAILDHAVRNRDRAGQAVGEAANWIARGAPRVNIEARKTICEACDQWEPLADGATFHCAQCKCLAWKLAMATARCPLNRW